MTIQQTNDDDLYIVTDVDGCHLSDNLLLEQAFITFMNGLLDLYYGTEEPISRDILKVSARIGIHPFVVEKILDEFFVLKDDGWHKATRIKSGKG